METIFRLKTRLLYSKMSTSSLSFAMAKTLGIKEDFLMFGEGEGDGKGRREL